MRAAQCTCATQRYPPHRRRTLHTDRVKTPFKPFPHRSECASTVSAGPEVVTTSARRTQRGLHDGFNAAINRARPRQVRNAHTPIREVTRNLTRNRRTHVKTNVTFAYMWQCMGEVVTIRKWTLVSA